VPDALVLYCHLYVVVLGLPAFATIVNVAFVPTFTLWSVGCVLILGA